MDANFGKDTFLWIKDDRVWKTSLIEEILSTCSWVVSLLDWIWEWGRRQKAGK